MKSFSRFALLAFFVAISGPALADETVLTNPDGTIVVSQGIVVLPTLPRPPEPMPLDAD